MLEYILSFLWFWVWKIFTLMLNIIPVWWVMWILHLFDIDFSLDKTLDLYLLFFVWLLTFIIIGKVLLEKIYQTFFKSADWIWSISMFIKWLVGMISFKKLAEAMNIQKNIFWFFMSLFLILLLYMTSYKWITTFSDLVDYTFYKTDASNLQIGSWWNLLTWQTFSQMALKYKNLQKNLTWSQYSWNKAYSWNELVFKFNFQTWSIFTWNLTSKVGKYAVRWTYQLKHWFSVAKKRVDTINVNTLLASWNTNMLNLKEEYQKYLLLLTMNLDKKPDYLKTYQFMWFPLEPISFTKSTNFLYLTLLTILILSFWAMILAISPLFDLFLIIFIRRPFDYWDIISMLLRLVFAVWLWYQLFTLQVV